MSEFAMTGTPTKAIRKTRRPGFTLVELMAAVAIIVLLLTILMPTLAQMRTMFLVRKTQTIINNIHNGCLAYHSDLGIYPADAAGLVQALTGRRDDDGKEGTGFRLVERGKVYGPYGGTENLETEQDQDVFLDAFDQPIMYYRCKITHQGGQATYSYSGSLPGYAPSLNGYLKGPDGRYYRTDFVIISRGPDGKWEPFYKDSAWTESDDIANYKNQE